MMFKRIKFFLFFLGFFGMAHAQERCEMSETFLLKPLMKEKSEVRKVLWVIDDSGSMAEQQKALASATAGFIQQLSLAPQPFHISVITTSRSDTLAELSSSDLKQGVADDRITEFQQKILVGTKGRSLEQGVRMFSQWILDHQNEVLSSQQLMVVFFTDEDDSSDLDKSLKKSLKRMTQAGVDLKIRVVGPNANLSRFQQALKGISFEYIPFQKKGSIDLESLANEMNQLRDFSVQPVHPFVSVNQVTGDGRPVLYEFDAQKNTLTLKAEWNGISKEKEMVIEISGWVSCPKYISNSEMKDIRKALSRIQFIGNTDLIENQRWYEEDLDRIAEVMLKNPRFKLRLLASTSSFPTPISLVLALMKPIENKNYPDQNYGNLLSKSHLALSRARAERIRSELMKRGVPSERLEAKGSIMGLNLRWYSYVMVGGLAYVAYPILVASAASGLTLGSVFSFVVADLMAANSANFPGNRKVRANFKKVDRVDSKGVR